MEKLKNILDSIYSSEHGMLYFYIVLGVIALIFVVLIIITIIKAKKEDKKTEEINNKPEVTTATEEKEEPKEESKQEIKEEEPEYFSETQIFNKVLMDTENHNNNEDLTPSPIQNEELPLSVPEENELNKEETNDSVYLESQEDKTIITEELPVVSPEHAIETVTEEELNTPVTEQPEVTATTKVKEEPKEEIKEETPEIVDNSVTENNEEKPTETQSVHISNDEIKMRLAKLKKLKPVEEPKEEIKEETPNDLEIPLEASDTGLINIMNSAGINDDIELPAVKEAHNTEEIDTNKTI